MNRSLLARFFAIATIASAFAAPAGADTVVTFTAPTGFVGGTLNGFTFDGNWRQYGFDARQAPFMETFGITHAITFDAGSFDFASMSLGGNPWMDYGSTGTAVATLTFKDITGATIETDLFQLTADNNFYPFTKSIANVHEIDFVTTGYWRLDSITEASAAVPEPTALALIILGLGGLLLARKKTRK